MDIQGIHICILTPRAMQDFWGELLSGHAPPRQLSSHKFHRNVHNVMGESAKIYSTVAIYLCDPTVLFRLEYGSAGIGN